MMSRQGIARITARSLSIVNWYQSHSAIDIVVYGFLLGLGALQFSLSLRSDDMISGFTQFELAKSIIDEGFYGFNFKPETMFPPGFPLILVSLCMTVGCTQAVLIRSMSVVTTLGFIVSYELLRRLQDRVVAAVSCVLLATSPIFFSLATRGFSSDLPYFFASMLTLLLAVRLDATKDSRAGRTLSLLCGFFLVASLLIRSAGIALVAGLLAWLVVSFFADRKTAVRRVKTFLPILVLGVAVQAAWMQWAAKHEVLEWPTVEGYPKSYFAQLRVKNGNYPELGTASLRDIPSRVAQNLNEDAVTLAKLLTRKEYINASWYSPFVLGPVLLVLIGVACSIWPAGGGFPEWYFVSYETMCLLWPWFDDIRFFLPVAPLACLYLWRGGKILLGLAARKPRPIGIFLCLLSLFSAGFAGVAGWRSGNLQPAFVAIFWTLLAAVSAWMVWTGSCRLPEAFALLLSRLRVFGLLREKSLTVPRILGAVTVVALVVVGLALQVAEGRSNLSFDVTKMAGYAEIAAGKWIAANTDTRAVVMARNVGGIYHYSRRKVVWFPPSSDPRILMEGIRKHQVEFVVISNRSVNYWLPSERVCFDSLLRTYPNAFQLVHEEPRFRVFEFVPEYS
jgi:hypothetical protein